MGRNAAVGFYGKINLDDMLKVEGAGEDQSKRNLLSWRREIYQVL